MKSRLGTLDGGRKGGGWSGCVPKSDVSSTGPKRPLGSVPFGMRQCLG